jgi:propane monooxygenase reductase subunit
MLPLGHFTLRDTTKSKCFIGTGTGFAPLYCQIKHSTQKEVHVGFIFGVRSREDAFYEHEIREIGSEFHNFTYVQYFSREDISYIEEQEHRKGGYVTDWISDETIQSYEQYYLCGSPNMVKGAREKLESLGIPKEDIFWEQY